LQKNELEAKNIELQEKLSVCYAKEAKMEEDLIKYKSAIQNLSVQAKNAKALQTKVSSLQEELEAKQEAIKLSELKVNELLEQMKDMEIAKEKSLNETLTKKNVDLKKATAKINTLQESINTIKAEAEERYNQLNEELAEQKKNLSIKSSEYSNKLSNANKLIEQYRATAKTAVNKYIESQATRLGVKSSTIFEKLPKNYSFNDIDIICEELGDFKLKVSDLPFNIEPSKVTIKESKNNILPKNRLDDTIDESLMALANLD
jgi:chromosome segregation ATPase